MMGDWGVRSPWLPPEFLGDGESDEPRGDALCETVEPGRSFRGFRNLFLGL